ncbi:MAG: bifunctional glutamate N-acetyltransferase/amino-acid acetyltransferase ArgJ [Verrucomicrobia bacterium]|nr:bifunctional glutamate N-acetyltransferase/amino-acid acetyltransferase ArgJ [Verrucomicrobiota bacterium]MDA1007319.1 bifunctional glutamate N-acetyltransferase/amino-acid acetyltransferase ArgJ [Verrucomicrobiota bacterium]
MPYKKIKGGVCAPKAFLAAAIAAGIKNPDATRTDLTVIYSEQPCVSAGTFTTNKVKAAPVRVTQAHLRAQELRAIIANSGNANACTGVMGINDTRTMADATAKALGLNRREIGVCSTGVIGLPLPMDRITPKIAPLCAAISAKNGTSVAEAIMTSDTTKKEIAIIVDLDGQKVRIGACTKGAGMICPSMATMLCFVTTDANLSKVCLQKSLLEAVESSFNRICIDGDMSTNDTVLVLANGAAGGPRIARGSKACRQFRDALQSVLLTLAKKIVRDGERVTKFVTLDVKGAPTYADAKKVAEAVSKSALVKASWNGGDPNWGRIIHAVGYSRARIREELIDISYDDKPACEGGLVAKTPIDELRAIADLDAFTITINLHLGRADYTIYTSDISPEYIDFNRSEYAYWKNARI